MEIQSDAIKGRQFVATRAIHAGTKLLECRPYMAVISYAWARDRQVCWHCLRTRDEGRRRWTVKCTQEVPVKIPLDKNVKLNEKKQKNLRTTNCWAVYCSDSCRDADARHCHSNQCCRFMQELAQECQKRWNKKYFDLSDFYSSELACEFDWEARIDQDLLNQWTPASDDFELMQMVLMALCRRQFEMDSDDLYDVAIKVDPLLSVEPKWNDYNRIQDNELHTTAERRLHLKLIYQTLRYFLKFPFLGKDSQLFRAVVFREVANSFGIWDTAADAIDDSSELLGYAVYPGAVFFNHSCAPNVSKRQIGRFIEFYASSDVAAGEPLCISYGDVTAGVEERRERLWLNYFFNCDCSRCVSEL